MAKLVYAAFNVYALGLLVYVVCSWIHHPKAVAIREFLGRWYEPFLRPLRQAFKPVALGGTGFDFTPILLLIAIVLVRKAVVALLVLPF